MTVKKAAISGSDDKMPLLIAAELYRQLYREVVETPYRCGPLPEQDSRERILAVIPTIYKIQQALSMAAKHVEPPNLPISPRIHTRRMVREGADGQGCNMNMSSND